MLFNLFGKKEPKDGGSSKDIVWASTAAKFNALAELHKKDPAILFIGWFPETVKSFREYIKQFNIDDQHVMEAKFVHGNHVQQRLPVFIEHYPLHEKETALLTTLNIKEAIVYSALDEPFFKFLGSDKIIPMMKMMGMKEDEAINHSLVSKSIQTGQEKFAAKVTVDQTANSQEEWIAKNLK